MDNHFRQLVVEKLHRGEELPREWARELFPPERREYELVYHGKEREEDVIANTMAVPLQPVRTFGKSNNGFQNMLIFGDNLQALKRLWEMKNAGELCNADGSVGVRLVYIDPPFASKREFRGTQDQKAYQDKIAGGAFIEFLRRRLIFLRDILSDDGSMFVHLDTKKSHYIKVILDELFKENGFRNEIVWRRQSAHSDSNQCGSIHDTILFYTKSPQWTWNDVLTRPSADYIEQFFDQIEPGTNRRYARGDLTAGGLSGGGYEYEFKGIKRVWRCPKSTMKRYDSDGRLHWPKDGVPRLKRYLDEFKGVPLQDVWQDIKVIHNQSPERVGYPTQKPEALMERIIKASSHPGDLVMDVFVGSGTTCAVAEKLDRRWIAVDCGKLAIYTTQKRMLGLTNEIGNKGKRLRAKPFTLYNAGLYDFSKLRQLAWNDWRFFALQLFECRDEPHSIGGLHLDGKRKGASVLVFDHVKNAGKRVDEETIEEIHSHIGKKITNTFYIIAPSRVFDFQQDYIDIDRVRYYALRIPYSIINELHSREFTALEQPRDERAVNETIDAVGFDFIQPPKVEWTAAVSFPSDLLPSANIKIRQFQSRARVRSEDVYGGLESLSMLMLDYNYDGEVFDFDTVFFNSDLEAANWEAHFPYESIGDNLMAVFIDIHGNEAQHLIPRSKFAKVAAKKSRNPKRKNK